MVLLSFNSLGVYTYPNGDRYDGEWKDDQKSEKGTMYYANGGKYEGELKNDEKNGEGIVTI